MKRDMRKASNKVSGGAANRLAAAGKREDDRITKEIKEHLGNHHEIDTSAIEVDVTAGDVDLTGEVDNPHAKSLSRSIAEQEVSATKSVKTDNLKFRRDSSEAP